MTSASEARLGEARCALERVTLVRDSVAPEHLP